MNSDTPESNPANYIWKIFYYNPKDERLFLPKPNPEMGTTINFAKRGAVVVFLLMIGFFSFVVFMIVSHQK
jgi:uncharacterized membrane protein